MDFLREKALLIKDLWDHCIWLIHREFVSQRLPLFVPGKQVPFADTQLLLAPSLFSKELLQYLVKPLNLPESPGI